MPELPQLPDQEGGDFLGFENAAQRDDVVSLTIPHQRPRSRLFMKQEFDTYHGFSPAARTPGKSIADSGAHLSSQEGERISVKFVGSGALGRFLIAAGTLAAIPRIASKAAGLLAPVVIVACNLPAVTGVRTTATSAAALSIVPYDPDVTARLLVHGSKASAIEALRNLLMTASVPTTDWSAIARRIYGLADPSSGTTGEFDHALAPASALELAGHLDNLGCRKILWVGCGHAPEAILWLMRKATAGAEAEILGLEKTLQAVDRGHMLLRRAYMAYYGCPAEEAAALDLTQPISIGLSHITIAHADMFEYSATAAAGAFESYDTIFSAAGRDASDSHGMRLSILLMAMASLLATGRLLMYRSMWGEKGVRAPQPAAMEGDFTGQLQGSNESRHIRAHIMGPMFVQKSTGSSREHLVVPGWRRAPVRNLTDGTRIAVYWASENLYFFGFIKRHTIVHDRDIGILYRTTTRALCNLSCSSRPISSSSTSTDRATPSGQDCRMRTSTTPAATRAATASPLIWKAWRNGSWGWNISRMTPTKRQQRPRQSCVQSAQRPGSGAKHPSWPTACAATGTWSQR